MGQKIGLLGGTFDPIHNGHLNLAFELMEKKGLDQVWFIPAQLSPFKTEFPAALSIAHRLAMVESALTDIPQFYVKDIEQHRPPPSYTIDTIKALIDEEKTKLEPKQFFLLMGEDAIAGFSRWQSPEEIVQLIPLMIGSRVGEWQKNSLNCSPMIEEAIKKGWVHTRLIDISSTQIRQRLAQGLDCRHLLPSTVHAYIQENQLYQG